MAEIIDNVKVGLFIKSLLKEKLMTQDQLAEQLNITKAAVSQNLNGKSAFDIQNLVKIAEIFNLTLDDLIAARKKPLDDGDEAEYLKIIKRGLDKFKKHNKDQLNLGLSDVYGKLFIDYLLELKLNDWIQYLVSSDIPFVDPSYHRFKKIMTTVMIYVLKNNLETPLGLIKKFVSIYGELTFESDADAKEFLTLLNQKIHKDIASILIQEQTMYQRNYSFLSIKFPSVQQVYYVNQIWLFKQISDLKLFNLFLIYFEKIIQPLLFLDQERYFTILAQYEFIEAITYMIKTLKPTSKLEALGSKALEKVAEALCKNEELETIQEGFKKQFIQDANKLTTFALMNGFSSVYEMMFDQFFTRLNLKKIVLTMTELSLFQVMEKYPTLFEEKLLSYVIDAIPLEKVNDAQLKSLVKLGARFSPMNANWQTAKKMNMLLNNSKGKTSL